MVWLGRGFWKRSCARTQCIRRASRRTPSPPWGEGRGGGLEVPQHDPLLIERARTLRRGLTFPERRLWYALRGRRLNGLKFRRQHPIDRFIVDFVCLERRLIIDLDGDSHIGQAA